MAPGDSPRPHPPEDVSVAQDAAPLHTDAPEPAPAEPAAPADVVDADLPGAAGSSPSPTQPEPSVAEPPAGEPPPEVEVVGPEAVPEVEVVGPEAEAVPDTTEGGEERPAPGTRPALPMVRILEGVVTSVSSEEVEVTLDDGRAAVISRRNFGPDNEDPTTVISVGDRAFGAKLTREDPKQRVVLSRAWALKLKAWDSILEAVAENRTVTARVVSAGAKGVVVDAGVRGFVPSSHLELEPISDLKPYVDQVLELKVLEADPMRERLVLSRRSLLLKKSRRKAHELLTSLKPGETARGRVTSITDYGAFVDIGGVNGLVHLSELSWQRVRRAGDVVALGDEVDVVVLDIKAKKRRVSLSIRQTRPDPLSEFEVGEVRRGRVTRLVDFGAFVSLGEVEGLVHLSELAEYRVSTPDEVVAPGDEVGVKILSVDRRRRRIELSIRQAAEYGG